MTMKKTMLYLSGRSAARGAWRTATVLTALLTAAPLSAQTVETRTVWSLSDCISYALEHNITVRNSELTMAQRDLDVSSAKGKIMPNVSAQASESLSFGRGLSSSNIYVNQTTSNTFFQVGLNMPVFQGMRLKNGLDQSRLNLEAATADLEKVRDDIRVAVAQAYVQILYDIEIRSVAQSQLFVDSLQVVRLTAMAANGKASSAEVSAQEATYANSRLSFIQADNNLRLAVLDLTQLLELPSPEGFQVVVPAVYSGKTALTSPEDIYAAAVDVKPQILSEKLRLKSAEKGISIAKGAFYPTINFSAGIGSNYYTVDGVQSLSFGEQLKQNFSPSLGLSLNIPIFTGLSNRNSLRSARLSYETQQLQLDNAGKTLYKEIQQAYYSAVAAEAKFEGCTAAQKSAEIAFEQTSAKYENAKANLTEYNEAKNRLTEASSNLAQARWQYLYQVKLLDFYRGYDLVF